MGIFRNEEKKVRETIELYANGIIEKDIDMLMSLVAFDDDFLYVIQKPYEKIIGAKKFYVKMKRFLELSEEIDISINWMFLSCIDNIAWVNTEMLFIFTRGNRLLEENRSITFVLEKRRGDWYIVHALNSIDAATEKLIEEEASVSEETEVYDFENNDIELELGEEENDE